jgi:uncharacterized protein (TIGR04255 family)
VALGIQFRPLFGLRGINLGPLRERWRGTYPRVEEQPPLPPAVEALPTPGELTFQLNVGAVPPVRHWFLSESGTQLVQLQQDRLIVNWREGTPVEPYPRYGALRQQFEERITDLQQFLRDEDLGELDVTQAEVNYINGVKVGDRDQGDLSPLLRHWGDLSANHLGNPEQASATLVFRVPDIGRGPVRMHIAINPAQWAPDAAPAIFFTLMVRGAPTAATTDAALQFMDGAHDHLLTSFNELTSDTVHQAWGQHT